MFVGVTLSHNIFPTMYTCTVHLSQRVTKFMCKNSISYVFFMKGIIKMFSCLTILFLRFYMAFKLASSPHLEVSFFMWSGYLVLQEDSIDWNKWSSDLLEKEWKMEHYSLNSCISRVSKEKTMTTTCSWKHWLPRVWGKLCLHHRTACQSWALENFLVEMRSLPQEEWTAE